MKIRLLLTLLCVFLMTAIQSAVPVRENAHLVPEYLKTENFVRLSPKEFGKVSGQKLNFIERLYFRKLKKRLIKSDYNSESNVMEYYDAQKSKFKFDPLWFILGCMIGPFAVLFSFTIKDKSRNKQLSALIGVSVFILWFGWLFIF